MGSACCCLCPPLAPSMAAAAAYSYPPLPPPPPPLFLPSLDLQSWIADKQYDAVGVATFGPVDPKPSSATWGYITTTPKPNWAVSKGGASRLIGRT